MQNHTSLKAAQAVASGRESTPPLDIVATIRAAMERDGRAAQLTEIDERSAVTREAEQRARELEGAFVDVLIARAVTREAETDAAARRAVAERFARIPRRDYIAAWRREGQRFSGPLWFAAMRQRVAEELDALFREALRSGEWIPDGQTRDRQHMGLTGLVIACERQWEHANSAMTATSEVRHAA